MRHYIGRWLPLGENPLSIAGTAELGRQTRGLMDSSTAFWLCDLTPVVTAQNLLFHECYEDEAAVLAGFLKVLGIISI